jgi:hypothetical protein
MSSKSIWRAIHEALIADDHDHELEPPTVEEMLAYRRGDLDAQEEARVRERLVAYPELARAVAQPFPPEDAVPGDADYITPEILNRRWKALQQRIHGAPRERGRTLRYWQSSTAVAAMLALSFGVLLWKARSELGQPRVAWEEVTLLPDGKRGGAETLEPVEPNAESLLLDLSLYDLRPFAGYRIDILDSTDRRSLWSSAITRRGSGNFVILVPRAFLRPGTYEIILYGVEGRNKEPLSTYSLYVPRR